MITLFSVGGSCDCDCNGAFRVLGACGFLLPSFPRLGRSLLGSGLHWAVEGPGRPAPAAAAAAPAALLAAGGADPAEAMLPAGPAAGLRSHGEFTVVGTTSPPLVFFRGCVCLCAVWVRFGVFAIAFHGVTIIGAVSFLLLARLVLVLAAGFQAHVLPVWSAFMAAALLALSSSFFSILWFAFSSHFCFILNGRLVMSDASLCGPWSRPKSSFFSYASWILAFISSLALGILASWHVAL